MKAKVYNMQNAEVNEVELNDIVFGAEYNEALIHQVIVAQHNKQSMALHLEDTEVKL